MEKEKVSDKENKIIEKKNFLKYFNKNLFTKEEKSFFNNFNYIPKKMLDIYEQNYLNQYNEIKEIKNKINLNENLYNSQKKEQENKEKIKKEKKTEKSKGKDLEKKKKLQYILILFHI